MLTIEAVYENGVFRPVEPLTLVEHQKVRLTVEPQVSCADRTAGIIQWTGDAESFDRILRESEFDFMEE